MKRNLKNINSVGIYYFVSGEIIYGKPPNLRGDVSGLRGDVSGLSGNVTGLRGDASGLRGDVTGLSGNVTYLRGDVDNCEITDAERSVGINISDLIGE